MLLPWFMVSVIAWKFSFLTSAPNSKEKDKRGTIVVSLKALRRSPHDLGDSSVVARKALAAKVLEKDNKVVDPSAIDERQVQVGPLMVRLDPKKHDDFFYSFVCRDPASCGIDVNAFSSVDLRTSPRGGKVPVLGGRIHLKKERGDKVSVSQFEFFPALSTEPEILDFLDINDSIIPRKNR